MSQHFRNQITSISSQIDHQILRINHLLQQLSKATSRYSPVQPKTLADDCLIHWNAIDKQVTEQSCILNDTHQQTNFYGSTADMQYRFVDLWQNFYEEILLDDYKYLEDNLIKEITVQSSKLLKVSPKSNWVDRFLDEMDVVVCVEHKQQMLRVVDIENGVFKCQSGEKNTNSIINLWRQEIYSKPCLNVIFPKLTKGFELAIIDQTKQMVYQLYVEDEQSRIFIQIINTQGEMQRCLILKETYEKQYEIVWGFYDKESIQDCILLQKGTYIILSLSGSQKIQFYIQPNSQLSIRKAQSHPLKTFTLLKRAFSQCKSAPILKRAISLLADQQCIQKQFSRSCYMNFGIIVQLYENIYDHQVLFVDEQRVVEDMNLLFEEIYTEEQMENRLAQKEKIVKFYGITQKPAKLFVPKKKVLMGNKFMENMKFHSVFK